MRRLYLIHGPVASGRTTLAHKLATPNTTVDCHTPTDPKRRAVALKAAFGLARDMGDDMAIIADDPKAFGRDLQLLDARNLKAWRVVMIRVGNEIESYGTGHDVVRESLGDIGPDLERRNGL